MQGRVCTEGFYDLALEVEHIISTHVLLAPSCKGVSEYSLPVPREMRRPSSWEKSPSTNSEFFCLHDQLQTTLSGSTTTTALEPHGIAQHKSFLLFDPVSLLPKMCHVHRHVHRHVPPYHTLHTFASDSHSTNTYEPTMCTFTIAFTTTL